MHRNLSRFSLAQDFTTISRAAELRFLNQVYKFYFLPTRCSAQLLFYRQSIASSAYKHIYIFKNICFIAVHRYFRSHRFDVCLLRFPCVIWLHIGWLLRDYLAILYLIKEAYWSQNRDVKCVWLIYSLLLEVYFHSLIGLISISFLTTYTHKIEIMFLPRL